MRYHVVNAVRLTLQANRPAAQAQRVVLPVLICLLYPLPGVTTLVKGGFTYSAHAPALPGKKRPMEWAEHEWHWHASLRPATLFHDK